MAPPRRNREAHGCNCRGEGGQGGCGELDVAEVLALRRLAATAFDFGSVVPSATVGQWLANAGTSRKMP